MAIKLLNAPDEFDHVMMTELHLVQSQIFNHDDTPKYELSFAFRRYKINLDQSMEYAPLLADTDYDDDYYTLAINSLGLGDARHITALAAVQDTITKFLEDNFGYTTEVV